METPENGVPKLILAVEMTFPMIQSHTYFCCVSHVCLKGREHFSHKIHAYSALRRDYCVVYFAIISMLLTYSKLSATIPDRCVFVYFGIRKHRACPASFGMSIIIAPR